MNIPDIPLLLDSRIVPVRWGDNGEPSVAMAAPVTEDSMVEQTACDSDTDRDGKWGREAQCLLSSLEYFCNISSAACPSPTVRVSDTYSNGEEVSWK